MKRIIFNTSLIVLCILTIILFTAYYILDSIEPMQEISNAKDVTGTTRIFQATYPQEHSPSKTTRYYQDKSYHDDKLFAYLEKIQRARENTFMKGRVFLEEK